MQRRDVAPRPESRRELFVVDHQASVLDHVDSRGDQSFGEHGVTDSRLQPHDFRSRGENVVHVRHQIFGPAEYIDEVHGFRDLGEPSVHSLPQDLRDVGVVHRHRNHTEARLHEVVGNEERGLVALRFGLDSEHGHHAQGPHDARDFGDVRQDAAASRGGWHGREHGRERTIMRMRNRLGFSGAVALVGCIAAGAGCNRAHRAGATANGAWYDAQPLLVSLRPSARVDLARVAGVAHLEDLPLYDLDVSIDHTAGSFTLHQDVWFTNTENVPLSEVVLRVYANVADPAHPPAAGHRPPVNFVHGECVGSPCTVTAESPSVIAVRPSTPVAPHGRLRMRLDLSGVLQRIDGSRTNVLAQGLEGLMTAFGAGEGAGDYGILAMGDGIVSMANFYPVLARRRAGTWERSDASTMGDLGSDEMSHVRAQISVDRTLHVATTGVQTADSPMLPGPGIPPRRHIEIAAAMVRDFAILAGPDLQVSTRNVGGIELRSHYLSTERAAGEHALDVGAHALEIFERRFGPYPYADLDIVESALVGGAGGVEFAGLVTIASMFYRPALPTSGPLGGLLAMLGGGGSGGLGALGGLAGTGAPGAPGGAGGPGGIQAIMDNMREFVVAHEVGHQWWHGLVGSDSRLHPYLDEGLAQFSAMLYLEDRYDPARAARDGDANVRMNYQVMRLMGQPDGPVDRPVSTFGSPITYAGLVYGRGPYMYRDLRRAMGDPAFFDGMREYVARYRFRLAPPRALVDLLASTPRGSGVRAIAARWLDESHGDDDLGRLDLGQMLASMLGLPGGSLPPEMQQAMQFMQQALNGGGGGAGGGLQGLLSMLGGNGGIPGLGGGSGGVPGLGGGGIPGLGGAGGPDVNQLMQQLQQMLQGTATP